MQQCHIHSTCCYLMVLVNHDSNDIPGCCLNTVVHLWNLPQIHWCIFHVFEEKTAKSILHLGHNFFQVFPLLSHLKTPTETLASLNVCITLVWGPQNLRFSLYSNRKECLSSKFSNIKAFNEEMMTKIKEFCVSYHTLIMWLIMHWSHAWSVTDHVPDHALITWLIMHSSPAWSCTDHVADHALITKLIIH